jgi:hypothetical protein
MCKVAAPLIYDVIYLPIDSNTPLLSTVVLTTPVGASTTKLLSPSVKNRMNGLERQSDGYQIICEILMVMEKR